MMHEVIEEYDDAEAEGDTVGRPSDHEHMELADGEPMTYEDFHRKKHGDVDTIVLPNRKKHLADPPEWRPPPPVAQHAPPIRVIPGGPYVPGSFVGRKSKLRGGALTLAATKKNAEQ